MTRALLVAIALACAAPARADDTLTNATSAAPAPAPAAAPITANDPQTLFAQANKKYFEGDWAESARLYAAIVERFQIEDPALYHNLGNACFRSGAYGLSILYYKRAQKLEPDAKLGEALAQNVGSPGTELEFAL